VCYNYNIRVKTALVGGFFVPTTKDEIEESEFMLLRQSYEQVQRPELATPEQLAHLGHDQVERTRIDAILADADAAQAKLARNLGPTAIWAHTDVRPDFDWNAYQGADFNPIDTRHNFDWLGHSK